MTSISTNLPQSIMPQNQASPLNEIINTNKVSQNQQFKPAENTGAYSVLTGFMDNIFKFDSVMDNVTDFKDMIYTAQDAVSLMKGHGENIRSLIEKAQLEGVSQESMDAINSEIAKRISDISSIFNNTQFNGINLFQKPMEINIPDWRDVAAQFAGDNSVEGEEENSADEITQLIADISFDCDFAMDIDGNAFNMNASAKIKIGYCDDGSLQISVDASMDFDLSGILKDGANSDNAMNIINDFLNMLGVAQNDLSSASNIVDRLLGNNILNTEVSDESESSKIVGKIVQQATIKLDGAYQTPNIAINML